MIQRSTTSAPSGLVGVRHYVCCVMKDLLMYLQIKILGRRSAIGMGGKLEWTMTILLIVHLIGVYRNSSSLIVLM